MTCESLRNRLLALPSPVAPVPELAAHLTGCSGCRAFAERAGTLDALIVEAVAWAVPPSESAKAAFLDSLAALGPVIHTKPTTADRHSGTYRPLRALARRVDWKYAVGIAAALLVAVTAWRLWPAGQPPLAEKDGPRQQLLAKQGKYLAVLAGADSADARLRVWADWTTDLRTTTADVYKAAAPDDLAALERMFDKAVRDGVLKHADRLPRHLPAAERVAVLRDAQAKLAADRAALDRLRADAPPAFKENLKRMADAARDAQVKLAALAEGV